MKEEFTEQELRFLRSLVEDHIASPAAKRVPLEWLAMWRQVLRKLEGM